MSSFSATIFCCLNIIYGDKLNLLLKPVRNNVPCWKWTHLQRMLFSINDGLQASINDLK